MRFVTHSDVASRFRGKSVAIVGSGPSVLENAPGFVDGHDLVLRANNYKTGLAAGFRCDVHYSFYGSSIRKSAEDLKRDGVTLCMCKCPDSKPIESAWHEANGKQLGIDFRYIYRSRQEWWFCDTYVPDEKTFVQKFELLDKHIPTTGFAAILDVLECEPKSIFLTGFDFFTSGMHNVNEKWREGDRNDPIGHRPEFELSWLSWRVNDYPITCDAQLKARLFPNWKKAAA